MRKSILYQASSKLVVNKIQFAKLQKFANPPKCHYLEKSQNSINSICLYKLISYSLIQLSTNKILLSSVHIGNRH